MLPSIVQVLSHKHSDYLRLAVGWSAASLARPFGRQPVERCLACEAVRSELVERCLACEADRSETVERCLACEADGEQVKLVIPVLFAWVLYVTTSVSLRHNSATGPMTWQTVSPAHHGLASEAALHESWRAERKSVSPKNRTPVASG
jgi:hypothetical protein